MPRTVTHHPGLFVTYHSGSHHPKLPIEAFPEEQAYRNQDAIRSLFERLAIQIKQFDEFASCYIARIQ